MLSPLQDRVAGIIGALQEAEEFALAGGAALILRGEVDRQTRDLDFFGPAPRLLTGSFRLPNKRYATRASKWHECYSGPVSLDRLLKGTAIEQRSISEMMRDFSQLNKDPISGCCRARNWQLTRSWPPVR